MAGLYIAGGENSKPVNFTGKFHYHPDNKPAIPTSVPSEKLAIKPKKAREVKEVESEDDDKKVGKVSNIKDND